MLKKVFCHLLVIFSYCLLAAIFTYPLILNLQQLLESKIHFFVGLYLSWPKLDIFSANIILLACLVISAYLAYLIAEMPLKNKMLAWGAGILFAFSFYNLNSWDSAREIIFKLVLLPLYIFLWLKYFEKRKEAYYYLALLLLIIFSYSQYAVALSALFVGIILLIFNREKIIVKKKVAALTIIFITVSTLFFINNFNIYKISEGAKITEQINNALAVTDLFTPFHKSSIPDHLAYIGIIPIILIIISLRKKREKEWQLWFFSTIFFFVLSLGPFLKFINLVEPHFPLPYLFIFQYFPFSALLYKPYNFFIVAQLGVAILAMYGFSTFFNKNAKSLYRYLIFICCLGLIGWETSALPQNINPLHTNSYYQTISNSLNKKNILEINDPSKNTSWVTDYIDKKFEVNIINNANINITQPILSELFISGEKKSIIKHDYSQVGPGILSANNIGFINFDKNYSNNYRVGEKFLKKYFAPLLVYEDAKEKIYQLPNSGINKKYYLQIEPTRWSYLKNTKSKSYREAKNDASMIVYNFDQKELNLDISMNLSSDIDQDLKIYLDDQVLSQQRINPETSVITISLPNLSPGEHSLRLHLNKKIKIYSISY